MVITITTDSGLFEAHCVVKLNARARSTDQVPEPMRKRLIGRKKKRLQSAVTLSNLHVCVQHHIGLMHSRTFGQGQ